jgi:hypothetical protein
MRLLDMLGERLHLLVQLLIDALTKVARRLGRQATDRDTTTVEVEDEHPVVVSPDLPYRDAVQLCGNPGQRTRRLQAPQLPVEGSGSGALGIPSVPVPLDPVPRLTVYYELEWSDRGASILGGVGISPTLY